ncbi:MAG TPA: histidine kinase dimerization/phosphoacceptor domain -containing protein, partial [Planctomycetaceae bacterium]|nr:histidine kinase dimerization/phosphoacceptor domain -containing protein [Planctomycetaceae bacterium]
LEPECVKILDSEGRLMEMNPAGLAMIQAESLDQVAGACMAEMIAESHRAMFYHMHRQVLAGASVTYEFPAYTLDGRQLWLESHAVPYRDNEGRIIGQLAVTRDMTQRKIAENELRASDARYRQLFDSNPQPMWVYDLETLVFLAVNDAAIQHYGYTRDEFLAMTIKDIRPPEDIPALLESIKHIPAGIDKAGIWRHRLRSGALINVEITSHSLHLDGRLADLVLAIDITERLRIEERLRTSLSEKTAMLKEIHHRVKNNLQIIMSLLNLQAGQTGDLAALGVLRESQNRVRSMSLVHETLYQSENLARIDMRDYLDSLVKYLFRSYGVDSSRIQIRIDIDDLSLDLHQAIPFGLIINELISNSLKYAFPGNRSGEISIQQRSIREHFHTFVIADDGIGLPEPLNLKALRTLGLQLVHDLIQQLLGTLTVVESPQLQFSISFPMDVQQEMTA